MIACFFLNLAGVYANTNSLILRQRLDISLILGGGHLAADGGWHQQGLHQQFPRRATQASHQGGDSASGDGSDGADRGLARLQLGLQQQRALRHLGQKWGQGLYTFR